MLVVVSRKNKGIEKCPLFLSVQIYAFFMFLRRILQDNFCLYAVLRFEGENKCEIKLSST
jgi:hypothetical protein